MENSFLSVKIKKEIKTVWGEGKVIKIFEFQRDDMAH